MSSSSSSPQKMFEKKLFDLCPDQRSSRVAGVGTVAKEQVFMKHVLFDTLNCPALTMSISGNWVGKAMMMVMIIMVITMMMRKYIHGALSSGTRVGENDVRSLAVSNRTKLQILCGWRGHDEGDDVVNCPTQLTLVTWICQLISTTNTGQLNEHSRGMCYPPLPLIIKMIWRKELWRILKQLPAWENFWDKLADNFFNLYPSIFQKILGPHIQMRNCWICEVFQNLINV